MKLAIAHTPNGQQIHIVTHDKFNDDEIEVTACHKFLDDLDSPELGEHRIVYQAIPPLEHFNMCPMCKRIYEDERKAIDVWNQRVLRKEVK